MSEYPGELGHHINAPQSDQSGHYLDLERQLRFPSYLPSTTNAPLPSVFRGDNAIAVPSRLDHVRNLSTNSSSIQDLIGGSSRIPCSPHVRDMGYKINSVGQRISDGFVPNEATLQDFQQQPHLHQVAGIHNQSRFPPSRRVADSAAIGAASGPVLSSARTAGYHGNISGIGLQGAMGAVSSDAQLARAPFGGNDALLSGRQSTMFPPMGPSSGGSGMYTYAQPNTPWVPTGKEDNRDFPKGGIGSWGEARWSRQSGGGFMAAREDKSSPTNSADIGHRWVQPALQQLRHASWSGDILPGQVATNSPWQPSATQEWHSSPGGHVAGASSVVGPSPEQIQGIKRSPDGDIPGDAGGRHMAARMRRDPPPHTHGIVPNPPHSNMLRVIDSSGSSHDHESLDLLDALPTTSSLPSSASSIPASTPPSSQLFFDSSSSMMVSPAQQQSLAHQFFPVDNYFPSNHSRAQHHLLESQPQVAGVGPGVAPVSTGIFPSHLTDTEVGVGTPQWLVHELGPRPMPGHRTGQWLCLGRNEGLVSGVDPGAGPVQRAGLSMGLGDGRNDVRRGLGLNSNWVGAVNSSLPPCLEVGCPEMPLYGWEGSASRACEKHKEQGMVNLKEVGTPCRSVGCERTASFGLQGGEAETCVNHKTPSMVNVKAPRCSSSGCTNYPVYGQPGTTIATCCVVHKKPGAGMVMVKGPLCQYSGCARVPSYGNPGDRRPTFCAGHRMEGMVDVKNARCKSQGCMRQPSFGHEGAVRATFCCEHKAEGMINIKSARCQEPGCGRQPSFGLDGGMRPVVCALHKQEGMINLKRKKARLKTS